MSGVKGMHAKNITSPQRAEAWRNSIRIGLIRNRLMKHLLGELEMSATQLRAAEILISKTLPNMAHVEHTGEIEHNHIARLPQVSENTDQWQTQHTPPQLLS